MKKSRSLLGAFGLAAMLFVGAACSDDDAANDALKDAGVDANINTGGGLPSGFPEADVPTPELKLETGVTAAGTYTLRYTATDAKANSDAYKTKLTEAGYTISGEADFLAQPNGNIAFTATKDKYTVSVSSFNTPDKYMAVVVLAV